MIFRYMGESSNSLLGVFENSMILFIWISVWAFMLNSVFLLSEWEISLLRWRRLVIVFH